MIPLLHTLTITLRVGNTTKEQHVCSSLAKNITHIFSVEDDHVCCWLLDSCQMASEPCKRDTSHIDCIVDVNPSNIKNNVKHWP